ncbi:hypothetical protein CYY_005243 [Polysphondylium violaceum]|uniref:Transmembrane protein 14 n=1 Tax=Polysphondylium violaceum TaxID=133409 RepID=A0A8J4PS38_9MYCE|nr:hypothetical protein CYY_005243 [Polysphondylium violaceum]
MSQHINYSMAGLTLVGGVIGYAKAKSLPSLIAGTTFSVLYLSTGYLIQDNPELGHGLTAVVSTVLAASMGKRAIKSGKFVPAGAVASAAALTTLYSAKKYFDWKNGL